MFYVSPRLEPLIYLKRCGYCGPASYRPWQIHETAASDAEQALIVVLNSYFKQ